MKIVVVHGEDEAAARNRYAHIKSGVRKKGWEIVSVSVSDNFTLAERLTGGSLFPQDILFTIEDLKKVPVGELKWLKENFKKYDGSLLFYAKGNIPPAIRGSLPRETKYEKFETPKIIFSFLESFYPGNSKRCIKLFEELTKDTATELVVAMLARHLRDMYWILEGGSGLGYPSWRIGKIKPQAVKFTKEKLRNTIMALADIDFKSKTGGGEAKFLIEIFIVQYLG